MTRYLLVLLTGALTALGHRVADARAEPDRGDVPGWVLITIMTAGLVMLLWAVAGDLLVRLFENAVSSVTGPA